jgi:hypothetical protein
MTGADDYDESGEHDESGPHRQVLSLAARCDDLLRQSDGLDWAARRSRLS